MKLERKQIPFELKAVRSDSGVVSFEGYGSVFGGVDSYGDTIQKGAYADTLRSWGVKGKLPKMLLQHGGDGGAVDMIPVGKWDEMREDDHGLFARGHLFDVESERIRLIAKAMHEGEMDGLSIGFNTPRDGADIDDETGIRTLKRINLWELSIVTFPADGAARVVGVKSDGVLPTEREFERWLRREAGFTEAEAKTIIAKGYRQVRREAMPSEEACGDLLESVKRLAAVATGADAHGRTDAEGSKGRAR